MPGQGRLGDKANISDDAHGCPGCPHPGLGPAIAGSPDVFVNGRPALRVDDVGIHAACCGPNMWQAQQGAPTVFINGKAAFRMNDPSKHCGGQGQLIEGSSDVVVGDAAGGGGGSSGSSSSAASSSASNASSASSSNTSSAASSTSSALSSSASSASPSSAPDTSSASSSDASSAAVSDSSPAANSSPEIVPPLDDEAWFEIRLVGEDGGPVAGERYALVTPDGQTHEGFLDDQGAARVYGGIAGAAELTFPELDERAWEPA